MIKKIGLSALGILAVVAIFFALGPREQVDETLTFNAADIGDDVDAYLQKIEGGIKDITPGAEKQIKWHEPASRGRTEWAIVYVHGFSATLEEIRPLPDIVAASLGANIFYTRLTGHGRGGDAMGEASVNDWYNDVAEAIAIGRTIGENLIIISTSTGGTLTTWAAGQLALMKNVRGLVMVSPNYTVKADGASLLSLPWARQLLPLIFGKERSFEPRSEEQAKWWTTSYAIEAVLPLQASIDHVLEMDFEQLAVPAMFIFHPEDGVVDHAMTKKIIKRWGTNNNVKVTVEEVLSASDKYKHVIAGRILGPENTEPLAKKVIDWAKTL